MLECPIETWSRRLNVWSSPYRNLNKPPGFPPRGAAHLICLFIPQLEVKWVISQSRDPPPPPHSGSPPLSLSATAASPCESNYCNWARMESGVRWSLSSSHPRPHPLLSLRYSCTCSEMTSKHLFFFPLTQKSINSFQVRSKAQYTVQVFPKPVGQLTLPLDSDQARQMKGGCCHCSHMCEVAINKLEVVEHNFNKHPTNLDCALIQQDDRFWLIFWTHHDKNKRDFCIYLEHVMWQLMAHPQQWVLGHRHVKIPLPAYIRARLHNWKRHQMTTTLVSLFLF